MRRQREAKKEGMLTVRGYDTAVQTTPDASRSPQTGATRDGGDVSASGQLGPQLDVGDREADAALVVPTGALVLAVLYADDLGHGDVSRRPGAGEADPHVAVQLAVP
jgi:hypothetical protein